MEVVLQAAEGVPEGSILSIKWGETKRQAPVSKIGQPFRFNTSRHDPLPMKVEVLTPIAAPQMVDIDPAQDNVTVSFGAGMKVSLQHREVPDLQRPVVEIGDAADGKGLPAEKVHMAQKAATYLEDHDLVRFFQDLLHGLLVSKPKDPITYIEARLARLKKPTTEASPAPMDAPPNQHLAVDPPADDQNLDRFSDNSVGKRGSVRQQMRAADAGFNRGSMATASKVDTLMMTLQAASDNLGIVMPFLPPELRNGIESKEFRQECEQHFRQLDKEDRGQLTSDDLIDVIVYLTQGKKESIARQQCRRFTDMFDTDEDGLISIYEFTNMVQFVTVAGFLETPEGRDLIQQAMVQEDTFQDFITMIEADKERLWSILPFLPEWLVDHVTSLEFQEDCHSQFDQLNVSGSGHLQALELAPVIKSISKAHHMTITEEKCKQFTALFDTHGNGVIMRDEFIEFAQFLTVMNFLTNTAEGQGISERAELTSNADKTRRFIEILEKDPTHLANVLHAQPKPLVQELNAYEFDQVCQKGFKEIAGSDLPTTTVPPGELVHVIDELCKAHPFRVSDEQYQYFISLWDVNQKNAVTSTEFFQMARYIILLGFLHYQLENQNLLMADVMLGEEKMNTVLEQLKAGSTTVWDLVPFLPQELIDELTSESFVLQCEQDFQSLDMDGSGVLEPMELMPIIQSLSQAHAYTLTRDHCRRFVDIFDIERNGVISKMEFVHFVRFMMIMSYMETPEGQLIQTDQEEADALHQVDSLLHQLETDRSAIAKVMPLLPQELYNELTSPQFVEEINQAFKQLDKDSSGVLEPKELYDVIINMSAQQHQTVTVDQCERFTQIFDLRGDGVLRQDEFLDFARFLTIMSYLNSEAGRESATEALMVLEHSERIEDLIKNMEQDKAFYSKVLPYLPVSMQQELASEKFVLECANFFRDLDKDGNGVLEPSELFPVVTSMADAHQMALDIEQCQRFANVFDEDGDGLINMDEFVFFSRFMIVMTFLNSQDGQLALDISLQDEASKLNPPPKTTPEPEDAFPLADAVAMAAQDSIFFEDKSNKLAAENEEMRERMRHLEEMVLKMQQSMGEQEQTKAPNYGK